MNFLKKKYPCNVVACGNEIELSGGICDTCLSMAQDFKSSQKTLDEQFKQYASSQHWSYLWNVPLPRNPIVENLIWETMQHLLHNRDKEIAEQVNEMWKKKLNLSKLTQ